MTPRRNWEAASGGTSLDPISDSFISGIVLQLSGKKRTRRLTTRVNPRRGEGLSWNRSSGRWALTGKSGMAWSRCWPHARPSSICGMDRRGRADDFLRPLDAVHLSDSGGTPGDQPMEVAAVQFAYMDALAYLGAFLAAYFIG